MNENFNKIMELIIKENLLARKRFALRIQDVNYLEYLQEMCTIHVDFGRATGKTEYIVDHANIHDLIVVATSAMKKLMERRSPIASIMTCQEVLLRVGTNFEIIYIDEPHLVFRSENTLLLYNALSNSSIKQTFILLGR